MTKKLGFVLFLSCWIYSSVGYAQEPIHFLKIQPQEGNVYHFISTVHIEIKNGAETVMSTQMEQNIVSKITASNAKEVSITEKIEKIRGSSTSRGRTFDFDTSNPMAGNPTMNAQMEQLVGKDMTSRVKPDGTFVGGNNPFEGLGGSQGSASDFRTLTGNVRLPDYAVKIGDSWVVVDTVNHQGMTNISTTTWTLQEINDDLAVLSAKGSGTIAGSPPMLSDGKVEGTMTTVGSAKIELKTGISREAGMRIEAKMNISYAGQIQELTSVTDSTAKQIN